ncbi:GATA-domain-containing protein [Rhizoclosmatium globosum]|uniref:GATA-domain-containing protein n=1 Tax=Rhizoclosmatium globosum TaxID=329046 RepID=A0A1Y2CFF9_9FUNG|nr:GATA-domain-containing protein [Rhizoclosmatium globosum]|eukprot:ORY45544.1 GATA-domain-containing protein [Rhizoclosmatium globosum]
MSFTIPSSSSTHPMPPLSSILFSSNQSTSSSFSYITCHNCATTETPMWRRDLQGRSVCNACGVYFRVNGVNRIVKSGASTTIKKRVRVKRTSPLRMYPSNTHMTDMDLFMSENVMKYVPIEPSSARDSITIPV